MVNTGFHPYDIGPRATTPASLGACPACRMPVALDDDFARVELSLYLLDAHRSLATEPGPDAALRAGIDALGKTQGSGRLAAHSPERAVWSAEPADDH
jgi:hypothetical protein